MSTKIERFGEGVRGDTWARGRIRASLSIIVTWV